MATYLEGVLIACEGNIEALYGESKTWDGVTVLHLMREIVRVHGRLRTRHTSWDNLRTAARLAIKNPSGRIFDSMFVRELTLYAMGDLDTGLWHTRSVPR